MRNRIKRKHLLILAILLIALVFFVWEAVQLSPAVRIRYLRIMANQESYGTVARMLDDEDHDVSEESRGSLVRAGRAAVPHLLPRLSDPRESTRSSAALVLGQIGPDANEALPALKTMIRQDEHESVRAAAAKAIGLIGRDDPALIDELIAMLDTGDESGRQHAVEALAFVVANMDRVVAALAKALKDELPRVREEAAESLGRLGPRAQAAVPALIDALDDPEAAVRGEALEALLKRIVRDRAQYDAALLKRLDEAVQANSRKNRPATP